MCYNARMMYLYVLIPLILIDGVWLTLMGKHYRAWLAPVFANKVLIVPVVIFYLVYAAGIVFFVVQPAIQKHSGLVAVFLTGAFLGLLAYAAYDLTNQASIKEWPVMVTIIDMAWGAFVTGAASTVAVIISRLVS